MTSNQSAYFTLTTDNCIHLIPKQDSYRHNHSPFCMCVPRWDEENQKDVQLGYAKKRVYVHRIILAQENLN